MSYAAEFQVGNDPKFYGNNIRLPTKEDAESYALAKLMVWTVAHDYRVVESTDPANYQVFNGSLVGIVEGESDGPSAQPAG